MDCQNSALNNLDKLEKVMKKACEDAKATILNTTKNLFPSPDSFASGISIVIILSESHASIHTYPEYNSCFVDFFTCGNTCLPEKFAQTITKYLKPQKIKQKLFIREDDSIKEEQKKQRNSLKKLLLKS
jgi:S-adenosylmethionine decarboxylase